LRKLLCLNISSDISTGFSPFIGLIFSLDCLLFPMFHIGGMPIKPSYLIIIIWVLYIFFLKKRFDRDVLKFTVPFITIITCALFGEIIMDFRFSEMFHTETAWSISIYLLVILSFGFSRDLNDFNFNWLWSILLLAVIINFVLIFFSNKFAILASFYYSQQAASDLGLDGVDEIFTMLRPRGIFGNPNTSMLQVNIIYLFSVVGVKAKLCKSPKGIKLFFCIVMPISLAIILGSRSELIVSCFYSMYLLWTLWGRKSLIYISLIGFVLVASIFVISRVLEKNKGSEKSDMLTYAISRITKTNDEFLTAEDQTQGIKRPLIMFEYAKERFLFSPLVGTGFNLVENTYPFNESPRYFHNDWFRIIATSGIIGFMSLLWVLYKFSYRFNPILLTPFILPGLTNTFLLSIPTIMYYFFMLGILHKKYFKSNLTG
jgi:oligosaccharide repeat unit polymerase